MDIESKYEELLAITQRLADGLHQTDHAHIIPAVEEALDDFEDGEWTESEWESSSC